MDFARIDPRRDAEVGATYHVLFDDELLYRDGQPIEIDMIGVESEKGKRAAAKLAKALDKTTSGRKNKTAKNMSVDEILVLASKSDNLKAKFYAELTTGWRNIEYLSDDDIDNPDVEPTLLEFSRENAEMLYSTRPWIMEGIDDFLGDRANFSRLDDDD